jgi:transcriptional regulator with XRE-family HTH domain
MTPFGQRMRELRAERGLTQQQQAEQLGVSKAYISALETGNRGRPSAPFVDQICAWLGLIWDDAEELKTLAAISHPKPVIDASGTHPEAVALANFLAQNIEKLDQGACEHLIAILHEELANTQG